MIILSNGCIPQFLVRTPPRHPPHLKPTFLRTGGGEGLSNANCWMWTTSLRSPLPVNPARVWLLAPVGHPLVVLSGVCGKAVEPPLVRYKYLFGFPQFSFPRSQKCSCSLHPASCFLLPLNGELRPYQLYSNHRVQSTANKP